MARGVWSGLRLTVDKSPDVIYCKEARPAHRGRDGVPERDALALCRLGLWYALDVRICLNPSRGISMQPRAGYDRDRQAEARRTATTFTRLAARLVPFTVIPILAGNRTGRNNRTPADRPPQMDKSTQIG